MKTLLWKRLKQQVMLLTIVLLCQTCSFMHKLAPAWPEWTYSTYIPAEERSVVTSIYAVRDTIIQGKKQSYSMALQIVRHVKRITYSIMTRR